MTQSADLREFEDFQGRCFRMALVLWMAALVISLIVHRAYSPIVGGIVIGGAASLVAFRFRVWTLRRLARRATGAEATRLPLIGAVRYVIMGAALALAAWLAAIDNAGDLIATAGTLLLCNLAIVIQAVRESRSRR